MKGEKIGLCIAYTGTNYGQLLQAYATQQVVRKFGYQTEIIKYHSGRNKGIKISYGAMVVGLKQIVSIIRHKIQNKEAVTLDEIHQKNMELRKKVADYFRQTCLNDVVECDGIDELRKKSKEYYAVIVGSDQVWLPDIAVSNFFTLRFAAQGVRRISYATSLGVSSYPNYAKKAAGDFWKQIDYLSVREQQGKKIIQEIVDVPVEVVADPTYLLTCEEWLNLIPHERAVGEKYILCYFLGDSGSIKQFARNFADSKGLHLISILSDECNSDDSQYADKVLVGSTVGDFVNLIRNAEYVLTDSFHGLAFSVINQKQFLVFYRRRLDVKESRNSRIDNIVKTWGIEERLIREPDKFVAPAEDIDYDVVLTRVEELRKKSLTFLEKALKD